MHAARLILLGLAVLTLAVACWLTGCGSRNRKRRTFRRCGAARTRVAGLHPAAASTPAKPAKPTRQAKPVDPIVVLHTSAGDIQVRLFRRKGPANRR